MTLLKDNNYKEINVALLSLEADIKNKITNFDTSEIDKQLVEINSRIDKINAGNNNSSAQINDIRYEIEDINSKLNGNSAKIENIEQKLSDIFSAENKVTDFNATTNSGIYYWVTDATNKPSDYGVLLVNKYDRGDNNSIWVNQIAYGTNNKIYFRQNINSGNWTEWKAVAFEGEMNATLTVNGKTYNGSEAVDAGVQTVANGGTGVTTQADINKAFIGNLAEGTSDVTDGTEFVSSYASDSGFSSTDEGSLHTPYKRQFVKVWNYIKDKISSVLGLTKDNYGGKAASAGSADTVDNYPASQLWRSDGAIWNPNANVTMTPSGNGSEWSFDFRNKNGATGTYWQVWDENKNTLLRVDADDGKVSAPYGFVGNLSGKADTAGTAATADKVASAGDSGMWIQGRANAICKTTSAAAGGGWKTLASIKTSSGSIEIGNLSSENFIRIVYSSDADVNAGNNNVTQLLYIRRGNIESPHEVIANSTKALSKMIIPIGAPSSLEDGCIWIS